MNPAKHLSIFAILLLIIPVSCKTGQPSQSEPLSQPKLFTSWCPGQADVNIYVTEIDINLYQSVVEKFENHAFDNTTISQLVLKIGTNFTGTPYVANTLEVDGDEKLVVNLRGMDCTTFVENSTAIAFAIKSQDHSFASFADFLRCLRYRNGKMNGYPSRLHYFTEWLINNSQKDVLFILSDSIGTSALSLDLSFMSRNAHLYKQLGNQAFVDSIKKTEKQLAGYRLNYIPKNQIASLEEKIKDGDIIAFTTSIAGLDVSHTGFAFHHNGRLHLLHASTRTNMVEITPVPLHDYLAGMNRVTGILVGRLMN